MSYLQFIQPIRLLHFCWKKLIIVSFTIFTTNTEESNLWNNPFDKISELHCLKRTLLETCNLQRTSRPPLKRLRISLKSFCYEREFLQYRAFELFYSVLRNMKNVIVLSCDPLTNQRYFYLYLYEYLLYIILWRQIFNSIYSCFFVCKNYFFRSFILSFKKSEILESSFIVGYVREMYVYCVLFPLCMLYIGVFWCMYLYFAIFPALRFCISPIHFCIYSFFVFFCSDSKNVCIVLYYILWKQFIRRRSIVKDKEYSFNVIFHFFAAINNGGTCDLWVILDQFVGFYNQNGWPSTRHAKLLPKNSSHMHLASMPLVPHATSPKLQEVQKIRKAICIV